MSFEKSAYTDAGVSMLSAAIHGSALTITRAVAGTGTADGELKNETDITGDSHELSILGIDTIQTDDGKPARRINLRTAGDVEAYMMHQVAIFGRLGDGEEALLFLMQDAHGIEVPRKTENSFEIEIAVLLAVSNEARIYVMVSPEIESILHEIDKRTTAMFGAPGGMATLDADGKLSESQRPEVDAYTKTETDQRISAAVDNHNGAENAHSDIRASVTAVNANLHSLELKFNTNITKNPFSATFSSLDGVTVTGVWNDRLARIEF